MSWQILMLFQNLLAASFALVSRQIAKKVKGVHFQVVAVVFSVILVSGWAYGLWYGIDINYLWSYLPLFITGGICFGLTNVGTYKALEYVDAGIATLFSTMNTVFAVIFATIVIHEGLSLQEIIGAFILFSAIWYVLALNINKNEKNQWMKALIISILAAILFAVAATIEKHLLGKMPLATYITFGWSFQALAAISCSILIKPKKWVVLFKSGAIGLTLSAGFIRALAGLLFIISLTLANNVSLIAVLSGVKVIFVVLLAALLLKERRYFNRKLEAAAIATIGIAVMLWH